MIRHVAVIDLGKTNSKVALVDTQYAVELRVIKQAASSSKDGLYLSLDHQAIEAFIVDAVNTLATEFTVDAITVTTHGATAALLDTNGQLALPVLDYECTEIDSTRSDYEVCRAPFSVTGSPALPGGLNIGAQLFWQQNQFPQQFASVKTVLTWPQYWVYKLTGERHNDVTSLGCHTDLYEPRNQRYSSLVAEQGWTNLMPPTRHSGQLSGRLSKSMSQRMGLTDTVPVFTGIHDSNASLVPHLITHVSPFSVVSTGTWFITMAIGGSNATLDERRDTLLNVNAMGHSVPSARFMGGRERELLGIAETATCTDLDQLLNHSNKPAILMPSVVPGTGPYPQLEKRWIDTDHSTDAAGTQSKEAIDCAATLYLAMMTNECLQLIGSQGPTYIEGPLAHDSLYAQMLAVVSQRPVMVSRSETGTSVGAAMLISPPELVPDYERIAIDANRHSQLHRYAQTWKHHLILHTR